MKEDNGLDDMFRDGLSEPGGRHAEYRKADWDALEKMLDERQKKRGIVLWLPLMGAAAAILLIFFGWLLLRPATGDKGQPVIVKHQKPVNGTSSQGAGAPAASAVASAHSGQVQATSAKPQTGVVSSERSGTSQQQRIAASVRNQSVLASSKHPRQSKTGVEGSLVSSGESPDVPSKPNPAERHTEMLYVYNKAIYDEDKIDNKVALTPMPDPATEVIIGPIRDPVINPNRLSLSFTVLASSTVNGVGSFQQGQFGGDVGALFSVGWRKFTISTGAIYAKTPYQTDFSNYHVKHPFVTDPEYVSADCRILDIPLNVSYQLYSKHRNTFSVGAGLSSYLMLKEDYTYSYPYPGTVGPDGYSTQNRNQHYFGVLNLSGTYQRSLNQKFSLALQPYVKLPLTNIGYGQVKLQSMGLAVGLSYHIN